MKNLSSLRVKDSIKFLSPETEFPFSIRTTEPFRFEGAKLLKTPKHFCVLTFLIYRKLTSKNLT